MVDRMVKQTRQPFGLISVLLNACLPLGDRHDAALDLGAFDAPEAETALLQVVLNLSEDDEIADAAGESLSSIWVRNSRDNAEQVRSFHPAARKFFIGGNE
jgi:hypothetical protein